MPANVLLSIGYYQQDATTKTIVSASVSFSNYYSTSDNDTYSLNVQFVPLAWFDLLNIFAFDLAVYVILYLILASISILFVMILWVIHWWIVRRRQKAQKKAGEETEEFQKLSFFSYFVTIAWPSVVGFSFAVLPVVGAVVFFWLMTQWLQIFNQIPAGYNDKVSTYSDTELANVKSGRMGICLLTIGGYILYRSSQAMIPVQREKLDSTNERIRTHENYTVWSPMRWKRSQWLMSLLLNLFFIEFFLELSHATMFKTWTLEFIVAIKVCKAILDIINMEALADKLLTVPLAISLQTTAFMVTLGAANFISFVYSFYANFLGDLAVRAYVSPMLAKLLRRVPQFRRNLARWLAKKMPWITRHIDPKTLIGVDWDARDEIINTLAAKSTDFTAIMFAPFVIALYLMLRVQLDITNLYGIEDTDLEFYLLFQTVVFIAFCVTDVFVLHMVEMMYNWPLFVYLQRKKNAFTLKRKTRWWGFDFKSLDNRIPAHIQSIDLLGFSSQYYFLISFCASGILLIAWSIQLFLRNSYFLFNDQLLLGLAPFVMALCYGIEVLCCSVGNAIGIWAVKGGESGKALKQSGRNTMAEMLTMFESADLDEVVKHICPPNCPHIKVATDLRELLRTHNCSVNEETLTALWPVEMMAKPSEPKPEPSSGPAANSTAAGPNAGGAAANSTAANSAAGNPGNPPTGSASTAHMWPAELHGIAINGNQFKSADSKKTEEFIWPSELKF